MSRTAAGSTEQTALDELVAQVLSTFDLAPSKPDARWRAHIQDLRRILSADYRGAVREFHRSGDLPVRRLIAEGRHHFPSLNEFPIQFDAASRDRMIGLGINLRLQPYARRPPLRGFYHREPRHKPIIWVNLVHPPGAVAASLAHELGHWYRERLLGGASEATTIGFFNSDFAAHLGSAEELFADVFPVLAAYPTSSAREVFPTGGWRRAVAKVAQLDVATLERIRRHLNSNYGFDMRECKDLEPPRRIYYLTSMLHFARLRWALLEELDV